MHPIFFHSRDRPKEHGETLEINYILSHRIFRKMARPDFPEQNLISKFPLKNNFLHKKYNLINDVFIADRKQAVA